MKCMSIPYLANEDDIELNKNPLYEVKQGTMINNTDSSVYDEIRYTLSLASKHTIEMKACFSY